MYIRSLWSRFCDGRVHCKKILDICETFIKNVTKNLWEGRRAGAKDFCITGDFNVEPGLPCTDEDDNDELNEMCGPLCSQGCENDKNGFKKLMWYGIMEFYGKVTFTWSRCGREREMGFTHRQFGNEGEGRTAQLDYIVGPRRTSDKTKIHNDVKTWDSWDQYPIYGAIQENEASNYFPTRK